LRNTVMHLEGWRQAGAAAIYRLATDRRRRVGIDLSWRVPPPEGAEVTIEVDGVAATGEGIRLSEGESLLTVRIARLPEGVRCDAVLGAIEIRPAD
jgi:hypothetical protein